ncbi:MAG: 2-C-methyl-D-erythritol 2,4-cyclodiphosphate synthase [Candidatus Atribacteria bacterium]|nr:2-C-methyl-D-erythritol 2,4-cyclodiphosphate synthase [Candidatus Atribacteria bacterium]
MRIGFGYDAHPLKKGKTLILGGVKIDYEKGLEGHSDADVVIHAVIDSLLGASGQGDIGMFFPDNELEWKGISSLTLLDHIVKLIERKQYKINNIDITVVLENPKLIPYYPDMKRNIASVLRIDENNINIKATTNEGMGYIGKGEGIVAFCVALLE